MIDEETKFSRAVAAFRTRLLAEEVEPKQRPVFRGEDKQDEFACKAFAPLPQRRMELDKDIEEAMATIFVTTQHIRAGTLGESGSLVDSDTLTFTEDYIAWGADSDYILFELTNFSDAQLAALVYTLNGSSLTPIADFKDRIVPYRPTDVLALLGGVVCPEGVNTLVILTTSFSATLNFTVAYTAP